MAFRGKCTFGTRPAIDKHLLNEYIYREVKHFRNYTTYRPNFRALPITGKFYAVHDLLKESEEQRQKVEEYADRIAAARARGPRSKYSAPVTSSHDGRARNNNICCTNGPARPVKYHDLTEDRYGWYVNTLAPTDSNESTCQRGRIPNYTSNSKHKTVKPLAKGT